MWTIPEQDAGGYGVNIGIDAAGFGVCAFYAGDLPNRGPFDEGYVYHFGAGCHEHGVA